PSLSICVLYTLSLHDALPIFAAPHVLDAALELDVEQSVVAEIRAGRRQRRVRLGLALHQLLAALEPQAAGGRRVTDRLRERHLRSEEHTSELQSRENLVCRLL